MNFYGFYTEKLEKLSAGDLSGFPNNKKYYRAAAPGWVREVSTPYQISNPIKN